MTQERRRHMLMSSQYSDNSKF
jgi:large subunit ribosomal protein L10e